MKRTVIVLLAAGIISITVASCRKRQAGRRTGSSPEGASLKVQLVGDWIRDWEFGPAVYQLVLNADGSMTMREYRAPAEGATSAPAVAAVTIHHRHYDQDVPLATEAAGTWKVEDRGVVLQMALSNGDPFTLRYKIERVTASELVLGSAGMDGKVDLRYRRRGK